MSRPRFVLSILFVALLGPCGHGTGNAQTLSPSPFTVPENPVLVAREDYAKYEGDMIGAAKWLEQTDLDKETDKRQQIDLFVSKWVTGSPNVTVSIDESIAKIIDKNPQFLFIYMANYSRSVLENKAAPNSFLAVKAGILSMLKVYKKGIGVYRNRQLERLAKMDQDNQIEDYILNMMKVQRA